MTIRWLAVLLAALVFGATAGLVAAQDATDGDEVPPAGDNVVADGVTTDEVPAFLESSDDTDKDFSSTLDDLSPVELWELIAGLIISGVVVPLIRQNTWSPSAVKLAAFATAAIVALVGSYLRGELDNAEYTLAGVLKLAAIVYASYEAIWKAKFLDWLPHTLEPALQVGTSNRAAPPPP